LCAHKLKFVNILSQLQKPVRNKFSVYKTKNLKLFFVIIVILIANKIVIVCFNNTGNKKGNKNKQEITMIILSCLCYTIYNVNKYLYYLYNFDISNYLPTMFVSLSYFLQFNFFSHLNYLCALIS
jgi:hypothetical protein